MNSYWPLGQSPNPLDIKSLYVNGFPGAPTNPVERDKSFEDGTVKTAISIKHLLETNPGNGKRALLFRSREKFDPGAFGQESQTTGDCTSHGDRNARDVSRCVEIHINGEAEQYVARGATEPTYGARGHSGAGMDPGRAARFVTEYGFMIRQKYPTLDLTVYDSSIGIKWGRSGVPESIKGICDAHPVGEYVMPETPDESMALFQNGFACHSGQNVGFSGTPSKKGYHERSGSWNHDMATVGYDDTREIWNERVYFVVNSWAAWNEQWVKWREDKELQKILGPPIDGMITVRSDVWERYFLGDQYIYFYSDITGFPAKDLPNYGSHSFL
jgi:hypothetical protein